LTGGTITEFEIGSLLPTGGRSSNLIGGGAGWDDSGVASVTGSTGGISEFTCTGGAVKLATGGNSFEPACTGGVAKLVAGGKSLVFTSLWTGGAKLAIGGKSLTLIGGGVTAGGPVWIEGGC
jgi:hypothetical protein